MKPDTHTFWDPEKGRYVTLGRCPKPLGSGVPTPAPTDDAEFRRKAVVAVDAVVSSAMSAFSKGFFAVLGVVLLLALVVSMGPTPDHLGDVVVIGTLIVVALRVIYLCCRKFL